MLISVRSEDAGTELEQTQTRELTLFRSLSLRRGGSPPVLVSDSVIVYHHADWTPAMAREFAEMRFHGEPIEVDVPEDFVESLAVTSVGSSNRGSRSRPQ